MYTYVGKVPVFFCANLGRGPRAFQVWKISKENPFENFVIVHNYGIFGHLKNIKLNVRCVCGD